MKGSEDMDNGPTSKRSIDALTKTKESLASLAG